MRITDLIWDFDGTLFDTYPPMCTDLKHTMAALGYEFTVEELLEQFTQSREAVLEYCAQRTGMTAEQVEQIKGRFAVVDSIAAAVSDADLVIEAVLEREDVKKSVFADFFFCVFNSCANCCNLTCK